MAINLKPNPPETPEHRAAMIELGIRVFEGMGIPAGPPMTPEEVEKELAELHRYQVEVLGIRPEDNIGSRELLRMRYGDDYDPDKDE